jgi:hypothetical protein
MSMKLMVRVLEECDLTRPQQAVLLAMAENARDDGTQCYPSVDLIAWKAGYKARNVVDIIRQLRTLGVLRVVASATAQRPTEYSIYLDRAPRKLTFEEWTEVHGRHGERGPYVDRETRENAPLNEGEGCNLTGLGVQSHVFETREIAPEPVKRTSKNQSPPSPPGGGERPTGRSVQEKFDRFWAAYPRRVKKQAALKAFARINPDEPLLERMIHTLELAKLSRQWRKDDGQFIPHPATWLNDGQWDDELTPATSAETGPPGVELLPGETAEQTGPGSWVLTSPDGQVRRIEPDYCGVIFDERIHTHSGLQDFYAAVRTAKAKHAREVTHDRA